MDALRLRPTPPARTCPLSSPGPPGRATDPWRRIRPFWPGTFPRSCRRSSPGCPSSDRRHFQPPLRNPSDPDSAPRPQSSSASFSVSSGVSCRSFPRWLAALCYAQLSRSVTA